MFLKYLCFIENQNTYRVVHNLISGRTFLVITIFPVTFKVSVVQQTKTLQ